jgi:hypothetical protein
VIAQYFTVSLLCWLLGLAMWVFCDPKYPKTTAIGKVMFWVGLLAWLLQIGGAKL